MEWLPHVTVATVIEKDGQYLLVEEVSHGKLVINQPAGHLEANETLQQAAIRETLEETGWTVELTAVLGMALYTSPHNQVTYHRTTFIATAISHDSTQPLDEGIEQALWMSYEDVLASSSKMRSELVIKTIEQYRAGRHYPLDIIFS